MPIISPCTSRYALIEELDPSLDSLANVLNSEATWEHKTADLCERLRLMGYWSRRTWKQEIKATVRNLHDPHIQQKIRHLLAALLNIEWPTKGARRLSKYLLKPLSRNELRELLSGDPLAPAHYATLVQEIDRTTTPKMGWEHYRHEIARAFVQHYDPSWRAQLALAAAEASSEQLAEGIQRLMVLTANLEEELGASAMDAAAALADSLPKELGIDSLERISARKYEALVERCSNPHFLMSLIQRITDWNACDARRQAYEIPNETVMPLLVGKLLDSYQTADEPAGITDEISVFLFNRPPILRFASAIVDTLPDDQKLAIFNACNAVSNLNTRRPVTLVAIGDFLLRAAPVRARKQLIKQICALPAVSNAPNSGLWIHLTSTSHSSYASRTLFTAILICKHPVVVENLKKNPLKQLLNKADVHHPSWILKLLRSERWRKHLLDHKLRLNAQDTRLKISTRRYLKELNTSHREDPYRHELLAEYFDQIPPFMLFLALQDAELGGIVIRELVHQDQEIITSLLPSVPSGILNYDDLREILGSLAPDNVADTLALFPEQVRRTIAAVPAERGRALLSALRASSDSWRIEVPDAEQTLTFHRNDLIRQIRGLAPFMQVAENAEDASDEVESLTDELRRMALNPPAAQASAVNQDETEELPQYLMALFKQWVIRMFPDQALKHLYELEQVGLASDADLRVLGIDTRSYVEWDRKAKEYLTPRRGKRPEQVEDAWQRAAMVADDSEVPVASSMVSDIARGSSEQIAELIRGFPPRVLRIYLMTDQLEQKWQSWRAAGHEQLHQVAQHTDVDF